MYFTELQVWNIIFDLTINEQLRIMDLIFVDFLLCQNTVNAVH